MSCCPEQSHGFLESGEYSPKGKIVNIDGLDIYHIGQGEKCIIWSYDIFGFNGGRTREFCDLLSEKGYQVVLPDYYRGEHVTPTDPNLVPFLKDFSYDNKLKADLDNIVIPFAKKNGAKVFGSVGTCWGTYPVIYLSSYPDFKAGVSMHPSHSRVADIHGENEADLLKRVKCPQLFLSANGEHPNCLKGGLAEKVLGDMVTIVEFSDMIHGWTTRGDLADEKIKRDVRKSFSLLVDFFEKHL